MNAVTQLYPVQNSALERAENLLREAERMQTIGRLASSIAHDLNNLLTGILLYCDLMETAIGEAATEEKSVPAEQWDGSTGQSGRLTRFAAATRFAHLREHIEEVQRAGEQGAALTRQLLAVARRQDGSTERAGEVIRSIERFLRRLMGERVVLEVAVDPSLDKDETDTLSDGAQLQQIVMNLVLNARDAMPDGGTIEVIARLAELPESQDGINTADEKRPTLMLLVKDNGLGMDEETQRRLFEPFFTTKEAGKGLGLATVRRIVDSAKGTIKVESQAGRGTSVAIWLPFHKS